jgi:hypothetical protein
MRLDRLMEKRIGSRGYIVGASLGMKISDLLESRLVMQGVVRERKMGGLVVGTSLVPISALLLAS